MSFAGTHAPAQSGTDTKAADSCKGDASAPRSENYAALGGVCGRPNDDVEKWRTEVWLPFGGDDGGSGDYGGPFAAFAAAAAELGVKLVDACAKRGGWAAPTRVATARWSPVP